MVRGLKTTYYLRTLGATHAEKSTLKGTDGKLNSVASVTMMSASPDHRLAGCHRAGFLRRGGMLDRQSRMRSLPVSSKKKRK